MRVSVDQGMARLRTGRCELNGMKPYPKRPTQLSLILVHLNFVRIGGFHMQGTSG
jgi:hypothetical protein